MPYDLWSMAQAKPYIICLDFREIILGATESVMLNHEAAHSQGPVIYPVIFTRVKNMNKFLRLRLNSY